jgi:peptidoglycan hydrolase-like protein with peptidoglycan-binding domain
MPDPYEGSLQRDAERGTKTIKFQVPGGRPDEICVVPKHLPFADYRGKDGAKDIADENQLASYDFNKAGPADSGVIAIVPKRTSTSAAVDVYQIPAGTTRPDQITASYCLSVEKNGKNVAKFKQTDNVHTTTCTAAILGYYHVARALGDICEIKPAVLRTMDIEQHKKMVRLAAELGAHGLVGQSWALFNRYYANPQGSGVAQTLFTSDFQQIYGALLENTTGEESYNEWLNAGSDLSSTRAFSRMADSRPVETILGSRDFTQSNVQALVGMRDMSEMILLDYLLAQSDRLTGGNISDYSFTYYRDGDKVKSVKTSKATDLPAGTTKVVIRKLTIKDTDAGLLNANVFEKKGYVSQISHLHPKTFARLQTLATKWRDDPTVKEFFHRECTFSNSQLARFEKYLLAAANTLQSRLDSGKLRLDLDLDDFFAGVVPPSPPPVVASKISGSVGPWEKGAVNTPADVSSVQRLLQTAAQKLNDPSLDPKGIDGKISRVAANSKTVSAIQAFQTRSALEVTGLIEPADQTWTKLLAATGETTPLPPPRPPPVPFPKINGTVGQWEKGAANTPADVSTVQRLLQTAAQKLNDLSVDPKGIDGKISRVAANSKTVSAIQAFQTRSALEVTGLIAPDDETWTKLLAAAGETTP